MAVAGRKPGADGGTSLVRGQCSNRQAGALSCKGTPGSQILSNFPTHCYRLTPTFVSPFSSSVCSVSGCFSGGISGNVSGCVWQCVPLCV